MHDDLSTIRRGWAVLDANDEVLGDVAESAPRWILVRKGLVLDGDLYVPPELVAETDDAGGRVYLTVAKADLGRLGLDAPPAGTVQAAPIADTRAEHGYEYGMTATDATAQGNVRSEVLEEAGARADAMFRAGGDAWTDDGDGVGGVERFERTSVDDLAGVDPLDGGDRLSR